MPAYELLVLSGQGASLEAIGFPSEPLTAYNFEVEEFHTYAVGEDGIWVHNSCNPKHGKQAKQHKRHAPKVLQTGGNTIRKETARRLNERFGKNYHPREWGRHLESLKEFHGLPPKHHGKIFDNGDYVDQSGKLIGNIGNYTH